MKKVLSLVLVIAMVLSSMSFAFAGTFEDVTGDYETAIDTLVGLGIITGYEDGTFRPEKTITRAEVAKLLVEILGYGDLVMGAKSNFTDTQGHWADQWIAIAAGRNIVIGTGDGKFTPDRQVSYDEVLTMIVRGLGYTDDSNEIKSMTWPTNFKVKAAELGVTDGVKLNATGADRGGVAQALYNALDATLVTVDNEGNVTNLKDVNSDLVPLITRVAERAGSYNKEVKDYVFEVLPKHLDSSDKAYAGNVIDLEKYLFEHVKAYQSKSDHKTFVYVDKSFNDTVDGTFVAKHNSVDLSKAPNKKFDVELADKTKKTIDLSTTAGNIDVYYNGKLVAMNEAGLEKGTADIAGLATKAAKVKVVLEDSDFHDASDVNGDVRAIVVSNPTFAQKAVAAYKDGSLKLGRIQLPKKGDNVDLTKVKVEGAVDDIDDIKADDVVVVYAAGGAVNDNVPSKTKLVVVRDTVEGQITRVNKADDTGSTTIYIDGTKYTRSEIAGRTETFDVGYEGTFFLDNAGKLFAADATDVASAQDYAVVIEATRGIKQTGVTLADAKVKLINAAGEVVTYKIDKDAVYEGTTNKVLDANLAFQGAFTAPGSKMLIQYKLDGDVIDVIEVLMADVTVGGVSRDTDSAKFEVAKDAPIFSVKVGAGTDKADYSVVDAENLPSSINITYSDYTNNGQYKVIVSTNADRSLSGTYALITGVDYVMDGNKKVAEIVGYVDGKEVKYLGKDTVASLDPDDTDTGLIFDLTMSGGKVQSVAVQNPNVSVATPSAIYVSSVAGTRLSTKVVSNNTAWATDELNLDNLTIYVLNAKDEFDYVETNVKNIVGLTVVGLYNLDGNAANGIEVIVVQ